MKKIILYFLIALTVLSFSACESDIAELIKAINSAVDQSEESDFFESDGGKAEYEKSVLDEARKKAEEHNYEEAMEIIRDGLYNLPDSEILKENLHAYKESLPVGVYSLEPYGEKEIQNDDDCGYADYSLDNYGNSYSNILFGTRSLIGYNFEEATVTYYLGSKYKRIEGTLYVTDPVKALSYYYIEPTFEIYGDDILLYSGPALKEKDKPVDFSVNIAGVEFLEIRIAGLAKESHGLNGWSTYYALAAGNVTLYSY